MAAHDDLCSLYPRMIEGDAGVVGLFGAKATIDSPYGAKQEPPEFVAETRAWLERHGAEARTVATMGTDDRAVCEMVLLLTVDGERVELPVMLVADVADDRIRDLRVYHSTWPLHGSHSVRPPVMHYDLEERPAEPVGAYHEALVVGDPEGAIAAFEAAGTVREPAGSDYVHTGAERDEWYRTILSDGPISLRLGTIVDDGRTVVFEYECDHWGSVSLPAQAGAAAYRRGPTGKIAEARIYDDIEPPDTITE